MRGGKCINGMDWGPTRRRARACETKPEQFSKTIITLPRDLLLHQNVYQNIVNRAFVCRHQLTHGTRNTQYALVHDIALYGKEPVHHDGMTPTTNIKQEFARRVI